MSLRLEINKSVPFFFNTHFHIYLRPPVALELPHNLNTDAADGINADAQQADATTTGTDQAFNVSYNEDPQTGEATMLLSLLVPYLPPLDDASVAAPSIVVAQAETAISNTDMTLGNCEDVQSPDNPNGPLGGSLQPAGTLRNYWASKFNEVLSINDAKVTVLDGPMHGKIEGQWLSKTGGPSFAYVADPGFLGQDKITFLVEVGGKSIKVVTTLIVVKVAGLHGSPCFSGIKRISANARGQV